MRLPGGSRYPDIELRGATVVITGAGRGIGKATASAFLRRGARVAIGDLDLAVASAAAAELSDGGTASGGEVAAFALDVTRRESFAEFLSQAEDRFGPVDVLVNNAGIMPIGLFLDQAATLDTATIDVNLWGPIHGMRLALPGMVARGRGHIVNIASLAGKQSLPGLGVYCASKHAVVGLTAGVRAEVATTGVSVTAVLPSMVKTELAAGIPAPGSAAVEPADVAAAVLDSVRTRHAEIAVPRWVGALTTAGGLLPEPVRRAVRTLIKADRGLAANNSAARAAYLERLNQQADAPRPRP